MFISEYILNLSLTTYLQMNVKFPPGPVPYQQPRISPVFANPLAARPRSRLWSVPAESFARLGMAKKATSAAAKAQKKAKVAQKVEKKEKKKAVKTKSSSTTLPKSTSKLSKAKSRADSDTEDDDLEGILDKEWYFTRCTVIVLTGIVISRFGESGKNHILWLKSSSKVHQADAQTLHSRRVL